MIELSQYKVLIRGAGELASAVGFTLHRCGFKVVMTDIEIPHAIRRTVCFCEAIIKGDTVVEGVNSIKSDINGYTNVFNSKNIPVLIDSIDLISKINPNFYVDGRMLKSEVADRRGKSYFTIGLGPGFIVNKNCDVVIETMRGHNLGKVIWSGSAQKNTGIPGKIGGESINRVIHSYRDGKLKWLVDFGTVVKKDQVIGKINDIAIKAQIGGIVRGLISPEVNIKKGMKIADIDPRGIEVDYKTISDKARNIGRAVLETILVHLNN